MRDRRSHGRSHSSDSSKISINLIEVVLAKMGARAKLLQSCRSSIRSLTCSNSLLSSSRSVATFAVKNEGSLGVRTLRGLAQSVLKPKLESTAAAAGSRMSVKSIFGLSAVFGFANFSASGGYAMADGDIDVETTCMPPTSYVTLVDEKDLQVVWTFMKKIWVPIVIIITMLVTYKHPVMLAIKITLGLLSTKPDPFSIYIYVEKLCQQYKLQQPSPHSPKPLYANKVDVTDYAFLCIGNVGVREQNYTLIGIFGTWWIWPSYLFQPLRYRSGFEEIRKRTQQTLSSQR